MPVLLTALLLAGCVQYDVALRKRSEHFVQGRPEGKADILWVIDNSASMSEEQALLASQITTFLDDLAFSGLDWNLGVTTTDAWASGGGLSGDVLTADTPSVEALFRSQATPHLTGDRDEHPLESAVLAVSPDITPGFLRAGASLVIEIVTDEDDHADDGVTSYLSDLDALVGAGNTRVNAIAGTPPDGCHSTVADAEVATRVIEAVTATGGIFGSICASDFLPALTSLALGAADMTDTFVLTSVPAVESLEVYVDGVLLHPRPQDGWQYDVGANAIVFSGYAIPRVSQEIEVRYWDMLGREDTATPL